MATVERGTAIGPAAEVNVKRVHITLLGADVPADGGNGGGAGAARPAPTDIFVVDGEPHHFAGQPGKLHPHPEVHRQFPETILHLKRRERAVWWSETEFHIGHNIALADDHGHPHPHDPGEPAVEPAKPAAVYPFSEAVTSEAIKDASGNILFWQAKSTEPVREALGHFYKISFTIAGQTVDPDMFCGGG